MANTEQSVDTLNSNDDIQHYRNLIESLKASVGAIGVAAHSLSANITIDTANSYTNTVGTFTASGEEQDFTVSGNKLTFNGTLTRTVRVDYGVGIQLVTSANNEVACALSLSGAILTRSIVTSGTLSGALAQAHLRGTQLVEMAAGQYIELLIANVDATTNLVIHSASLAAQGTFAQ